MDRGARRRVEDARDLIIPAARYGMNFKYMPELNGRYDSRADGGRRGDLHSALPLSAQGALVVAKLARHGSGRAAARRRCSRPDHPRGAPELNAVHYALMTVVAVTCILLYRYLRRVHWP